jgi:hypothetical protein
MDVLYCEEKQGVRMGKDNFWNKIEDEIKIIKKIESIKMITGYQILKDFYDIENIDNINCIKKYDFEPIEHGDDHCLYTNCKDCIKEVLENKWYIKKYKNKWTNHFDSLYYEYKNTRK